MVPDGRRLPPLLVPLFVGLILSCRQSRILNVEAGAEAVQVLVDTDVDADDVFAILYLLKQDPTLFKLKAITISANAWSNAGHAVNLIYDILHMMGRDDISVGVGGEGGITYGGSFSENVGGYLPLIEQRLSTWGGCRYRQAIPPGARGLLDIDSMYGIRKKFLPQGPRHYIPSAQPTTQDVMLRTILSGRTIVLLIGSHTNFATLLMTHPEAKKNVERIYVMGGGVNSSNPSGCCPKGTGSSCVPTECGDRGNLFSATESNPWAEFNIFSDPFAAYQVFHAGIPLTLVPLDATNTIPTTDHFFSALEKHQGTFEAQWAYQVLKIIKETWLDDNFSKEYFLWDSFTSGVLVSGIYNGHQINNNTFCVLEYKNLTVVTSNKPYGVQDGSNPMFDNRTIPEFHLQKKDIHSGHVQTGLQDPFCFVPGGKGKCQDGYTTEAEAPEGVLMQVGIRAKPNINNENSVEYAFQQSLIEKLNAPQNRGLYNFQRQFPCAKEVLYKPTVTNQALGKPVIFDMDMSPGDIITLFYLLKVPKQLVDLKAVTVTSVGWSSAATIDIVYDILHMMGRDDIPVGLGEFFALDQVYLPLQTAGACTYTQFIPNGAGGRLDSDTLFGLARDLPRSPRRYTAENSVKFGAPRNTSHPELRQPKAQEVIEEVLGSFKSNLKFSLLTGGPLTNVAKFLSSNFSHRSRVKEIFIVGGSVKTPIHPYGNIGNVFTNPENLVSEFNFFLDPQAAKETLESQIKNWLIPLDALHGKRLLMDMLDFLNNTSKATPEALFVHKLLLTIHNLSSRHNAYAHTAKLMEEIIGAVAFAYQHKVRRYFKTTSLQVVANGNVSDAGWTKVDHVDGKATRYLDSVDSDFVVQNIVKTLNSHSQSAVIANFTEQVSSWNTICS